MIENLGWYFHGPYIKPWDNYKKSKLWVRKKTCIEPKGGGGGGGKGRLWEEKCGEWIFLFICRMSSTLNTEQCILKNKRIWL